LVLDQSLRLWSKPKVLNCKIIDYVQFLQPLGDAYKDKWSVTVSNVKRYSSYR